MRLGPFTFNEKFLDRGTFALNVFILKPKPLMHFQSLVRFFWKVTRQLLIQLVMRQT